MSRRLAEGMLANGICRLARSVKRENGLSVFAFPIMSLPLMTDYRVDREGRSLIPRPRNPLATLWQAPRGRRQARVTGALSKGARRRARAREIEPVNGSCHRRRPVCVALINV
jgi:hypothetical protein